MASAAGSRPSIFVSSTIRDFADLRDALKFWLEELGFEVQMSEHTDFVHIPEAGAFDACFEGVRTSDYYLLMIGQNKGSLFDANGNISVTQQEYRVAYESFQKTGQPKIVAVLRHDVATSLRERAAAGSIAGGSTLQDWEFTRDFIKEVRREDEVTAAIAGAGDEPKGNWLSEFRDFRELTAILRSALAIRAPLPHMALLEGLRWECSSNLLVLLGKLHGAPNYTHQMIDGVRRELPLTKEDMEATSSNKTMTHTQIKRTIMQLVALPRPDAFILDAAQQLISSASLFEYDRDNDGYKASSLLEALYALREEVDLYRLRYPLMIEQQNVFFTVWAQSRESKASVKVPNFALFSLYSIHDRLHNIARLLLAIVRYLDGKTSSVEVQLRMVTPIPEFDEEIREERATREELDKWLAEDNMLLSLNMRDFSDEERKALQEQEDAIRKVIGDERWEQFKAEQLEKRLGEAGLSKTVET